MYLVILQTNEDIKLKNLQNKETYPKPYYKSEAIQVNRFQKINYFRHV
jgi:hypothetical protein